jgi:hypothetical protein
MRMITVISNSSGELCEIMKENNLALEASSQLFSYIAVERLKMYGT